MYETRQTSVYKYKPVKACWYELVRKYRYVRTCPCRKSPECVRERVSLSFLFAQAVKKSYLERDVQMKFT